MKKIQFEFLSGLTRNSLTSAGGDERICSGHGDWTTQVHKDSQSLLITSAGRYLNRDLFLNNLFINCLKQIKPGLDIQDIVNF